MIRLFQRKCFYLNRYIGQYSGTIAHNNWTSHTLTLVTVNPNSASHFIQSMPSLRDCPTAPFINWDSVNTK